jgi:transcriptional regulator with XRE-family HTH domain
MEDSASPLMLQRRLRTELRSARLSCSLTQEQVAKAMEWSLSKMNRIEKAKSAISINDLKALLPLYGITDKEQTYEELLDLARAVTRARGGRRDQWWRHFNEVAPATLLELLDYEAAASTVSQFETIFAPGILQTEEYASAVLQVFYDDQSSAERVNALVDLRTRRRDLLTSQGAPKFSFVLDESVIHREVGSPATMSQQLQYLANAADLPNVTIQIVPFTAGLHSGMKQSFELIQFAETPDENIVFLESPRGDFISDDPEETRNYLKAIRRIAAVSLSPAESVARLRKAAAEMT